MEQWKEHIEVKLKAEQNKAVSIDLKNGNINYSEKIKQNRFINVVTGDEEVVRAFLINRLINELDYKEELIELEKEYNIGRPKVNKARIDTIVKDDKGNPFFFIEVKAPNKFESDQEYIEGQLYQLAKLEKKVKYLVYYTIDIYGDEVKDRAIIIDYEKYPEYADWVNNGSLSIGNELTPGYNEPQKQPLIKGDKDNDLNVKINREEIEGLSKNLHNVLWGGGGTNDSEIFYSLVNIILAKIQDESEKEDGQEYDFQIYRYGKNVESAHKVFERINDLYKRALKEKLNITEERKLEKAYVINEEKFPINKLIYTVQSLEKYSFLEGRSSLDGKDILGDFFESITRDGFKQNKGQFFTPNSIVNFILYALKIDDYAIERLNNDRELPFIIDPSAGSGTFLVQAMKIITKELKYKQHDKLKTSRQIKQCFEDLFMPDYNENRWAKEYLYGADINFDLGTAAKVNMILHGDGSTNIFVKDGLLPFRFYVKDTAPNFLEKAENDSVYFDKEINGKFDIIVSNPPFSVDLDTETRRHLPHSFIFGDKKNSENLFIERWYQLLKDGGRFGVVLPESIFDTTENKYIRIFLFKYFKIKAVVSLPQVTFEPYTSTKTSILFAQKKTRAEVENWNTLWNQYGSEWSLLKTRIKDYVEYFVYKKDLNRKWAKDVVEDIENKNYDNIHNNIFRFLKDYITKEDNALNIEELLNKYITEINELSSFDKDTQDIFGYYNTWWVFGEVAKKLDYSIYMAEAENVGYKRTKRSEKPMPNDLYDIEYAPNTISKQEIDSKYKKEIERNEELKQELEQEKVILETKLKDKYSKTNEKKLENIKDDIHELNELINKLNKDMDTTEEIINEYYENGILKEEYWDRTDEQLIEHFKNGLLSWKKSEDILLRRNATIKILDFIRTEILWD